MDLRDPSQAAASMIDGLCKLWARHVQLSILLYFPSLQRQFRGSTSVLRSSPRLCLSNLYVRCPVCLPMPGCLTPFRRNTSLPGTCYVPDIVLNTWNTPVSKSCLSSYVHWYPCPQIHVSTCPEVSTSVLQQAFCMPA